MFVRVCFRRRCEILQRGRDTNQSTAEIRQAAEQQPSRRRGVSPEGLATHRTCLDCQTKSDFQPAQIETRGAALSSERSPITRNWIFAEWSETALGRHLDGRVSV